MEDFCSPQGLLNGVLNREHLYAAKTSGFRMVPGSENGLLEPYLHMHHQDLRGSNGAVTINIASISPLSSISTVFILYKVMITLIELIDR